MVDFNKDFYTEDEWEQMMEQYADQKIGIQPSQEVTQTNIEPQVEAPEFYTETEWKASIVDAEIDNELERGFIAAKKSVQENKPLDEAEKEVEQEFEPVKTFFTNLAAGAAEIASTKLRGLEAYTPSFMPKEEMIDTGLNYAAKRIDSLIPEGWKKYLEKSSGKQIPTRIKDIPEAVETWSAMLGQNIPQLVDTAISSIMGGTVGRAAALFGATATGQVEALPAAAAGGRLGGSIIGPLASTTLSETGRFLKRAEDLGIPKKIAEKYARIYGPISGAIEYAQSLISLGLLKGKAGKGITSKALNNKILNMTIRKILTKFFDISEEGVEEILQDGLDYYLMKKAAKEANLPEDIYSKPDFLKSFIGGAGLASLYAGIGKAGRITAKGAKQVSAGVRKILNNGALIKYKDKLYSVLKKDNGKYGVVKVDKNLDVVHELDDKPEKYIEKMVKEGEVLLKDEEQKLPGEEMPVEAPETPVEQRTEAEIGKTIPEEKKPVTEQITKREREKVKKEAWEMKLEEWLDNYGVVSKDIKAILQNPIELGNSSAPNLGQRAQNALREHYSQVSKALREGKPVPKEVLKDYPDLIKKQPKIQQISLSELKNYSDEDIGKIKTYNTRIGKAAVRQISYSAEKKGYKIWLEFPNRERVGIDADVLTGKREPTPEERAILKDIEEGTERLGIIPNRRKVANLVERIIDDKSILKKNPVVFLKKDNGEILLLDNEEYLHAAKYLGITPKIALLTEKEIANLSNSKILSLAKKKAKDKIPEEVLKDYPDLAKKAPETPIEQRKKEKVGKTKGKQKKAVKTQKKQAWEMTRNEWLKNEGFSPEEAPEGEIKPEWKDFPIVKSILEHKKQVQKALKKGKPVPEEVLKDYPDLMEKYGKKEIKKPLKEKSKKTKPKKPKEEKPKNPLLSTAQKNYEAIIEYIKKFFGKDSINKLNRKEYEKADIDFKLLPASVVKQTAYNFYKELTSSDNRVLANDRNGKYVSDGKFLIIDEKIANKMRDEYWEKEKKNLMKTYIGHGASYDEVVETVEKIVAGERKSEELQIPDYESVIPKDFKDYKLLKDTGMGYYVDKNFGVIIFTDGEKFYGIQRKYLDLFNKYFKNIKLKGIAEDQAIAVFVNNKLKGLIMPIGLDENILKQLKAKTTSAPSPGASGAVASKVFETEKEMPKLDEEEKSLFDSVLEIIEPAKRTEATKKAAALFRKTLAEIAHYDRVVEEMFKKIRRAFIFMSKNDVIDFITRVEEGRPQKTPVLNEYANTFRKLLDDMAAKIQSLGKGYLETFIVNYFPHLWKRNKEASQIFARILGKKRFYTKDFLKQRTIALFKEGIEKGLEPVSWNPVDIVFLRLHEMNKFYYMHKLIGELKSNGIIKFNYSRSAIPEGYAKINDNAFTVYMKPEITVKEAYDEILMEQLVNFAKSLGINLERKISIGGKRWGYADLKNRKAVTRFGGPESVLAHEIGHIIGRDYKLFTILRRANEKYEHIITRGKNKGKVVWKPNPDAVKYRKVIDEEWRKLADERMKNIESKSYRKYVRNYLEKEAVLVEALIHAPEIFKKVAPNLYKAFINFINSHAELRPLLDIKPSLVVGSNVATKKIPGFTVLGYYIAPKEVAKIFNNYLSPGLSYNENKIISGAYLFTRAVANLVNMAQLSMSLFHALNITTDIAATTMGIGVRKMYSKGQRLSGIADLLTSLVPAVPAIKAIWSGQRIRKAYKNFVENIEDKKLRSIVETIILAGGRDKIDTVYYEQGLQALEKTLSDVIKLGLSKETIPEILKTPIYLFETVIQTISYPIMGWFVPTGKLGMFAKMAEHEIARYRNGEINEEQLRYMLINVWDSIDNRMGMLVYDNLFWNRTFKDALMLAFRSVGWNLGSWREYGGAFVDTFTVPERLERGDLVISHKIAYAMSAFFIYAVYGAYIQKILTGEGPKELKDYFFPKDGIINPDGTPERLNLPTYAREWYGWGLKGPKQILSKLHPIWSIVYELSQNKDFFNVEIYHPDDPFKNQITDIAKYLAKQFLPISIKNYMQMSKLAPEEKAKNLLISISGITKAPNYISRTPALRLLYRILADKWPRGYKRTKEEYEKREYEKHILYQLRKGLPIDEEEARRIIGIRKLVDLKREAKRDVLEDLFNKLSLEEMAQVYLIANDEEKKKVNKIFKRKYWKNSFKLSKEEREYYEKIIFGK